jgi:hypothetical protein
MDLNGYGITTTLQPGWEGRIMKRSEPQVGQADGPMPSAVAPDDEAAGAGAAAADRRGWPERTYPVVHLANFGIPDDRGDFGSGAVELMKSDDLFITLFEYGPECVGQALFATQGLPRELRPDQFSPNALQRTITGQSGLQIFFTEAGRAFCLFIALGSHENRAALVKKANAALATITIQPQ